MIQTIQIAGLGPEQSPWAAVSRAAILDMGSFRQRRLFRRREGLIDWLSKFGTDQSLRDCKFSINVIGRAVAIRITWFWARQDRILCTWFGTVVQRQDYVIGRDVSATNKLTRSSQRAKHVLSTLFQSARAEVSFMLRSAISLGLARGMCATFIAAGGACGI